MLCILSLFPNLFDNLDPLCITLKQPIPGVNKCDFHLKVVILIKQSSPRKILWGVELSILMFIIIASSGCITFSNIHYIQSIIFRPLVKSAYLKNDFLISQPKHMLWVLKRTVSMRRFF